MSQCLSFAVPSQGGLSYEQANQTCLSFAGQLLSLNNRDEFERFELKVNALQQSTFSSAVTLFFRLGAWVDGLNDQWCDENDADSTSECVYLRKNLLKNNSLCLSRLKCDEEMPFICDSKFVEDIQLNWSLFKLVTAISERYTSENDGSGNQRFIEMLAQLAPVALNLLGNLFGTRM